MLEDAIADRLVLLRSLFEAARSRAQDPTRAGQHAALVLLDGACELALAHVADNLGITRRWNNGVEDVWGAVRGQLPPSADIKGWPGARLMHRARNSAQHEGILPDAVHLGRWVGDAEQFLHDLVDAAFGVTLSQVRRADALSSPSSRESFAQAESCLDAGDTSNAVAHALAAFDNAREQWREQRGAKGLVTPRTSLAALFSNDQALEQSVEQLTDFTEVQPFASDMGEYLWLTNLRARPGPDPTLAEAQRALVFVFEWVLRWEAFSARYDAEVAHRWRRALRPPQTEDADLGPRLEGRAWVTVSGSALPGFRPFVNVVLQLVDAPKERFEPWLAELQSALRETWRTSFPEETYVYPTVDRTGRVVVPTVRPDIDADAVGAAVKRAIQLADQRAAGAGPPALLDDYREAVTRITVGQGHEAAFTVVGFAFLDGTDTSPVALRPVIELEPHSDLEDLVREQSFAHCIRSTTNSFVQVVGAPPKVRVDRTVKPDELVAALGAALEASRNELFQRAEDRALKDKISAEVEARFRNALDR
ncbi:MAG: hypothetical protein ABSE77_20170 [Acidimicrobiales bacterium]